MICGLSSFPCPAVGPAVFPLHGTLAIAHVALILALVHAAVRPSKSSLARDRAVLEFPRVDSAILELEVSEPLAHAVLVVRPRDDLHRCCASKGVHFEVLRPVARELSRPEDRVSCEVLRRHDAFVTMGFPKSGG